MDNSAGFEKLCTLMRQTFNQPSLTIVRDTTANDVSGWDSLNHTILVLEIENAFGVILAADETAKLPNVGALWDHIEEKRRSTLRPNSFAPKITARGG